MDIVRDEELMMPTDPIRIKPGEAGTLIVQLPYSPDHVAKIKSVSGRRWHAKEQHWTVPQGDGTLGKLLNLFPGKPVEVDPALGAVKAGGKGKPSSGLLVPVLADLRTAVQARHYPGEPNRRMVIGSLGFCTFIRDDLLPRWPKRTSIGF